MTATTASPPPLQPASPSGRDANDPIEQLAPVARMVLAALLVGAGVIHLVMVPSHMQASSLDGWSFAVVGWVQVLLAVGVIIKPGRWMLVAILGLSLVSIAVWSWSRTTGLPWGGHAGIAEEVGGVDLFTIALEGATVLGAALLLWRPTLGRDLPQASLVVASAIPVLVLVATSVAVADPSVANHGHDETATSATLAAAGPDRCDLGFNPAAYWSEATTVGVASAADPPASAAATGSDGHAHGHGATVAPAAGVTTTTAPPIDGSVELDRLIAATTSTGDEAADARVIVELANAPDEAYENWVRWLPQFNAAQHASGEAADVGHGAHVGPQSWTPMSDEAQCDQLQAELDIARDAALAYPTAADAQAAGWRKVTNYVPGIAAHYMNFSYVDDRFEVDKPEMILYDGDGPEARVVGLSYYILQKSSFQPTQGFTGPNDDYHRHDGLCIKGGVVIQGTGSTAEQCAAAGGFKSDGSAGWMNHAWVVPGCESPWGVFSGASPTLDDDLAAASGQNGGRCVGSGVLHRYDLSPGSADNTPTTISGATQTATETAAGLPGS